LFPDLGSFIAFLEKQDELLRVGVEVDPELEITEIACRVVKQGGPALLFENVKGSSLPLLINPLGTERRVEWAMGRPPGEAGRELAQAAEDMMPPSAAALWKHKGLLARARHMKPRLVGGGPVLETSSDPDLAGLPVLKCWPEDGGRFITFPLVVTRSPANGRRNLGIYRMHVYDKSSTGMHWQIERGGGNHYAESERRGEPLPVAVVLGADPLLMMAAIFPLPEDMDELAFAGFLRGAATPVVRGPVSGLPVPAAAEIVLEGEVLPGERRQEGPFGDHFGHYSQAAPFPVLRVKKVHRRRSAVYTAAVVGRPPQEDKYMGNAVQEMFLPLLKLMHPGLTDLWAYYEAGFHNLAVAGVRQRYQKESLKTAFALLGQGQMSLTKCLILVDPDVNVRDFSQVLDALRENFDPRADFLLLPGTAQDTLDFTGPAMNLGSKMILDATSGVKGVKGPAGTRTETPAVLGAAGSEILEHRNLRDALLAVRVKSESRTVVERLVREPALKNFKLIAAVSEDVPLDDRELLLWGLFTRFDCARDLVPAEGGMTGAWPRYGGPLGIDATWKTGYPKPLSMDPAVVKKVDARWKDYGL
jgi:4-hydroxybenzoate decarboxylase subunit C